jgi:2-polyprenyl-3-methyl-5-hydroxy-6-metoxy-1,4-benzoquinol methylase
MAIEATSHSVLALRRHFKRIAGRNKDLDYKKYWQDLYVRGGNSGEGSYGENAKYKAGVINALVAENRLTSVLEFGCGDGNQLSHYVLPRYVGLDVSERAVELCSERFSADATKTFMTISPGEPLDLGAHDLVMSLEVLMHVIDEDEFVWTLDQIFGHSARFVAILTPFTPLFKYSRGSHERYRNLFPYLVPYIGEFSIVGAMTHPSVTLEQRRGGAIGEMASDFVILRREGAPEIGSSR